VPSVGHYLPEHPSARRKYLVNLENGLRREVLELERSLKEKRQRLKSVVKLLKKMDEA
jgi:hypothetical protein